MFTAVACTSIHSHIMTVIMVVDVKYVIGLVRGILDRVFIRVYFWCS